MIVSGPAGADRVHSFFIPTPTHDPGSKARRKRDGSMTKPRKPGPLSAGQLAHVFMGENDRLNIHMKAAIVRAWRAQAKDVTLATPFAAGRPYPRIRVVMEFVKKASTSRFDAANLMPVAKAVCDGLVDAGLVVDDANEFVVGPDCRPGVPDKENPGIRVHVIELPPLTPEQLKTKRYPLL